jgi:hypothetical protein
MEEYTQQLFELSLVVISGIVTFIIIPLIKRGGEYFVQVLEAKAHSARFSCATDKLVDLTVEAVAHVEATFVRKMKVHGKWDNAAAGIAKESAKDLVLSNLGKKGLEEVMGCLDATETEVMSRILTLIEVASERQKAAQAKVYPEEKKEEKKVEKVSPQ